MKMKNNIIVQKKKDSFFTVLNLSEISDGIELKDGIWVTRSQSKVSFPSEGYNQCFEIEKNSFWFHHRNKCIIEAVRNFPPQGPLFDIGGGNGLVSQSLIQNGFDTYLVEPGIDGICNAKKRNIKKLVCSTFEDARFHKNVLPAVGLFDVLEHIEDDVCFLSKIFESLIVNGRLFLTVPTYKVLWSDEDNFAGHFHRYTRNSLCKKLESVGFKIEYSTYIFSILPLPIFLFRTVPYRIFKKKFKLEENKTIHGQKTNISNWILNKVWKKELSNIRKKKEILFGGSLMLVARKN